MNQANVFKNGLYHWRILLECGEKIYFYNGFLLPLCVAVDKSDLALFDESYSYWLKKTSAIFFFPPNDYFLASSCVIGGFIRV
ncbi:hypothetical protein [Acidithiobacillus ferrooxidans]|uniref:hypothetical protein n=1 Tax=Acidithiobacillus ferrooxidans TaxID=920 RepID=UPI001D0250CB|nr:hypothetical protein [Acidithiobacillus ferrooxidans]